MKLSNNGCVVSKCHTLLLSIFYISSLVAVGLSVHFLSDRPPTVDCPANSSSVASASDSSSTSSTYGKSPPKVTKNVRLPRAVLPRHYDVRLFPILETGNFSILGHVSIELECKEETDRIVLHSSDIVVDPKSVKAFESFKVVHDSQENKTLIVDVIEYDTEMEFLVVRLSSKDKVKLAKGINYTLTMSFVGNLSDQLWGFYRSAYMEDGVEKYMATSQMEPTFARRAFPCFDEPNMKAVFTVTLGRHRDMTALSNMPLVKTTAMEGMDGFYWDQFAPSVPMSTYLVALIVVNFTQVQADVRNVTWEFNIYTRPSASNQAKYASNTGPKIQSFFEDYFQIPFPLPKQDMIAIPDFSGEAMENWGLITYGEPFLLYEENISSVKDKEETATLVSHEIAHQWFGNLVTMDWWTDLWLNEGVATYFENIGGNRVEPELMLTQQIVTNALHKAMSLDSLESSHAISIEVQNPDEIIQIFDAISYQKGATVIRMLANVLGEKTFRKAFSNYLNAHLYGNAVQDDFWEAFDKQTKIDNVSLPIGVKMFMDTWTLKMGFPVVSVIRDYKNNKVALSQERFLFRKSNTTSDMTVYLWWIYLTYTANFKTIGSTWLADNQVSKNLSLDFPVKEDQWLIFNVEETGYYRVNYDKRNWQLISQQLMTDHTAISVVNRAQIMDDALNLARANLLDYEIALDLTKYLGKEVEYLPWHSAFTALTYIDSMLGRTPFYHIFKKHLNKIISSSLSSLGFVERKANDTDLTRKLRSSLFHWACSYGNSEAILHAVALYRQWMADPNNNTIIHADLKSAVVSTAIREGGEKEWQFAFDRLMKSNVANEKKVLLAGLASTRNRNLLIRMLEMTMDSTLGLRVDDRPDMIVAASENHVDHLLAFDFIKDNWAKLEKHLLTSWSGLSKVMQAITASFNKDSELDKVVKFQAEHWESLLTVDRTVRQSIELIENNIQWMANNQERIVSWLLLQQL